MLCHFSQKNTIEAHLKAQNNKCNMRYIWDKLKLNALVEKAWNQHGHLYSKLL